MHVANITKASAIAVCVVIPMSIAVVVMLAAVAHFK
jgi:hypothetical protein